MESNFITVSSTKVVNISHIVCIEETRNSRSNLPNVVIVLSNGEKAVVTGETLQQFLSKLKK